MEDLENTLIACRWKSGTTSRPVVNPYNPTVGWEVVTTPTNQVLKLVGKRVDSTAAAEVVLIDYFPEAGGNDDEAGESRKTELNTLALDTGVAQNPEYVEMGSNMTEQPYLFTMAFYASSDAVALALMNDLRDRYLGRIVSDDHLSLWNYNDSDADAPVVRMEVTAFRYQQDAEKVSPWEVSLYFAELELVDIIDPRLATDGLASEPPPSPGGGDSVQVGEGDPNTLGVPGVSGGEYVDLETGDVYEWEA